VFAASASNASNFFWPPAPRVARVHGDHAEEGALRPDERDARGTRGSRRRARRRRRAAPRPTRHRHRDGLADCATSPESHPAVSLRTPSAISASPPSTAVTSSSPPSTIRIAQASAPELAREPAGRPRRALRQDRARSRARLPVRASCCASARDVRSPSNMPLRSSAPRAAPARCRASSMSSSRSERSSGEEDEHEPRRVLARDLERDEQQRAKLTALSERAPAAVEAVVRRELRWTRGCDAPPRRAGSRTRRRDRLRARPPSGAGSSCLARRAEVSPCSASRLR
jgi:hypothetical protein